MRNPCCVVPIARERDLTGGGECSITINSIPWSEVWIDGKNTTKHTPFVDYKLPCGKHKLAFKRSDMQIDHSENITVRAGQPFKQRIDPRARRVQAGLERVALVRQRGDLLRQQGVGPLQFLVANEQAVDAFGNLVDLGRVCHGLEGVTVNCRVCASLRR